MAAGRGASGARAVRFEVEVAGVPLAERVVAEAWSAGVDGVVEDGASPAGQGERLRLMLYCSAAKAEGIRDAVAQLAPGEIVLRPVEDVPEIDWVEAWKTGLEAIAVSERLVVRPSFVEYAARPGQVVLEIDPGQAFGTGGHASTLLALRWVDRLARSLVSAKADAASGVRVVDVGTGSGVLGMAAVALGAAHAVGFDLDPVATREAAGLIRRNRCDDRFDLFTGPIDALAAPPFDWVLVNLLKREMLPIARELAALVAPAGRLVLSGLLAADEAEVCSVFAEHGLVLQDRQEEVDAGGDHWVSPLLGRD